METQIEYKQCTECNLIKPNTEFHKASKGYLGTAAKCKSCKITQRRNTYLNLTDEQRTRYEKNRKARRANETEKDKQKVRDYNNKRYRENEWVREKSKAAIKNWRQNATHNFWSEYVARYRARKESAEGFHTRAEWLELVQIFENKCAYCGIICSPTKDHIVPLSRNGTDYIENITPACLSCNGKKGNKTASEFLAYKMLVR